MVLTNKLRLSLSLFLFLFLSLALTLSRYRPYKFVRCYFPRLLYGTCEYNFGIGNEKTRIPRPTGRSCLNIRMFIQGVSFTSYFSKRFSYLLVRPRKTLSDILVFCVLFFLRRLRENYTTSTPRRVMERVDRRIERYSVSSTKTLTIVDWMLAVLNQLISFSRYSFVFQNLSRYSRIQNNRNTLYAQRHYR